MQITLCWYWMCKNQLQDFFKRILLGQKGVRQFLGSFFLIWEFSLKFPSSPAPRSSAVFPLRSVRRLRRWIVGTCRRELQVANGAWEMLQGKPWASWGRFFLNFMLAFVWLEEIFATQNTRGRKECNNLWVFFFEFSGQSVWSGNVVTPCLFALLHPQKFGCDWWWRQQKNNGKACGRFCIRFFYGNCHKGENCEFCHLEHKESKLKLDKVWKKLRFLIVVKVTLNPGGFFSLS